MIIPIASTVLGSEKAISLVETNLQSPGNKGFHRYQIIYVVRDGYKAEFRRDMGLAKKWKGVRLINIPSYLEHSVDELMYIADQIRGESKQDEIDVKELLGIMR